MIVKNESKLILRCLESVRELIDTWIIVDTGSTDGTQEMIRSYFRDLPGRLYERPWVDFGHNRNEALQLARCKADYVLLIDADEKLLVDSFDASTLQADAYLVHIVADQGTSCRYFLLNNHPGWVWLGVLHECIANRHPVQTALFEGATIDCRLVEGQHPKTADKYLEDAKILEQALALDPENGRTVYYLAQSYGCGGDLSSALHYYQKRVGLGACWEAGEVFWSQYLSGCIQEDLKRPAETFLQSYEEAVRIDPTRAEPLYRLADYFFRSGLFLTASILTRAGLSLAKPKQFIAIQEWIYDEGLLALSTACEKAIEERHSSCCFQAGLRAL